MDFAPTTAYVVDVTTDDKRELMSALKDVPGITSIEDGGMYWEYYRDWVRVRKTQPRSMKTFTACL